MNIDQSILAFGTISLVAGVVGWVFQRIGQPRVIGEMTAGIFWVHPFSGALRCCCDDARPAGSRAAAKWVG